MAGYIIAAVGGAGSFFLQGALYAASGAMVLMVAFPARAERSSSARLRRDGRRPALRGVQPAHPRAARDRLAAVFPAIPVFGTLYPIYAKDEFAAGPTGLGLLLTAVGVGGTLGGFIANALGRAERQGLLQAVWVVVMAASIIGVALSPTLAVAIAFSVVGGAAEMAHASSNMAMLQIAAPEEMRGRISALLMLNPAFISIGALVAGPLSDAVGVRNASTILAATAIAAVLVLYASSLPYGSCATNEETKLSASKALVDDLVAASRILAQHEVLDAYGHVSARSDKNPERFIMSRSLAPALVTAADHGARRRQRAPPGDKRKGFLERYIHGEIYRARPR